MSPSPEQLVLITRSSRVWGSGVVRACEASPSNILRLTGENSPLSLTEMVEVGEKDVVLDEDLQHM